MNGYTDSATPPTPLVSYSYKADAGADDAWLHDRKKCQKKKEADCTKSPSATPNGCVWNSQQFCAPECAYNNSITCTTTYGTKESEIALDSTRKDGTGPSKNEVRRETAYEDFFGEVVNDRIFVTGVENAGTNNCKSLRQYVAALNGLAQINAFRDLGIIQGQDVWGAIVEKLLQNFRGITILLNDFHAMSLKMFPGIEFSEFDECPTGNTNRPFDEEGTPEVPLCTKTNFKTAALLKAQGAAQQGILRHACFCRQASSGYLKNADTPYLEWNQTRIKNLCNNMLASNKNIVTNKYVCEPRIGKDLNTWKSHLENLEPKEHKIMTYGTTAEKAARKNVLLDKMRDTINLVVENMVIDCGRLISTDTSMGTSNKGGNCIPFSEMNNILYKLEIMTSDLEKNDTFFITDSNTTDVHFARENATSWKESTSYNMGLAMEDIDSFSGETSDEQIHEAAFNVEIAMGLKRSVQDANEVTWLALREELTSLDRTRIIHSVAEKAAKNFMRITTTDSDDKAVDNGTDTDAENADIENPTPI
jgi:hypothetical protein